MRLKTRPDEALMQAIPIEDRLRAIPLEATIKGMFIEDAVRALGDDFRALRPLLVAPPRLGRFLPFASYPQVDAVRLIFAAVRKMYPRASIAEGARLLSRRDYELFARSTIGSVLTHFLHTPQAVYLKFPDVLKMVATGVEATAEILGERAVRIEVKGLYAVLDSGQIGTLEGFAMHFGERPEIDVDIPEDGHGIYDVRW